MQRRRSGKPCVLLLAVTLVVAALPSACVRPPAPVPAPLEVATAPPPVTEPAAKPAAADAPSPETPETAPAASATAPVAMKPAPQQKAPTAKATPASSLGGHDRHLVLGPFDAVAAADFELGVLASDLPPGIDTVLRALETSLLEGKLPLDRFGEEAATVCRIVYDEAALRGITATRFSAPLSGTGGAETVRLRVFARRADDDGLEAATMRSAPGLVILEEHETGTWRIEHFEFDAGALAVPLARPEQWDPYQTPPPP